jgi:hypothetical protein
MRFRKWHIALKRLTTTLTIQSVQRFIFLLYVEQFVLIRNIVVDTVYHDDVCTLPWEVNPVTNLHRITLTPDVYYRSPFR